MGVNTTNPIYNQYIAHNQLCRDAVSGDDAIKTQTTNYVSKLSGQDDDDYKAMLNRATYENYTNRTLDGLTGLLFAKTPLCESTIDDLIADITLNGKSHIDLAQILASEVITVGRVSVLVDMNSIDTSGMTLADVQRLNLRPYATIYPTESIINWKYETINNKQTLSMVVLKENVQEWISEFDYKNINQYRVLKLVDGVYNIDIYKENDYQNTIVPKMNGKTLSYIPFIALTQDVLSIEPQKAPIYDLSKLNISLFQLMVEMRNAMFFSANPTIYGSGIQLADGESIKLGSNVAHIFSDYQAKLEFVEFKGDGLGTYERKISDTKETMSLLGSRMLSATKQANETENTVAMRSSGERAILISIADTLSRAMKQIIEIMAEWSNRSGTVEYEINTDYNLTTIDYQMLNALTTAQQMGALSKRDLFTNLKKGELIEDNKTFEEWQSEIEEDAPTLSVQPVQPETKKDDSLISTLKTKLGL